jgi:hypothetical protein
MKRVWVAQCLCPSQHCILANAGEAETIAEAQYIGTVLREVIEGLIANAVMNPWCSLCRATALTWRYELTRTTFETMEAAEPILRRSESIQAAVNAMFGDLKRSD